MKTITPEMRDRFWSRRPKHPSKQQTRLMIEAFDRVDALIDDGWTSLGRWVNAQERDIASGHLRRARDSNAKYREEFAQNIEIHNRLGITETRFIARRREEDGLLAE